MLNPRAINPYTSPGYLMALSGRVGQCAPACARIPPSSGPLLRPTRHALIDAPSVGRRAPQLPEPRDPERRAVRHSRDYGAKLRIVRAQLDW
eukprot:8549495-Pyramimonas_sp.AAC.1